MPNPVPRAPLSLFFVLFVVSGFAGLIYQSIWSHYLKLFLGHAAHAQTLVLVMFMGGMAIGAWLISRFTHRLKKLLLAYALVELLVGILALTFHPLFVAVIDVSYGSVLPQLAGTGAEPLYKWLIAALLILPQSILLGTTFPLMSGGVVRTFRALPGASVSGLYFTNSLGAAIGVLVAGFYLINRVGLPGTLMTAGLLNIGLAIALWALSKQIETADANAEIDAMLRAPGISADAATIPSAENASPSLRLMLLVALATGAITFIYEIAWIRMLSLVLGSSTHSFELMLSAMIFGIAFGSLWIKRRIDAYHNLLIVLGVVLCLKGLFAVATLPLYMGSFDVMHALFHALNKTPFAYGMYNVAGQVISMSVMVPSAFFAGMSLPMITIDRKSVV